MHSGKRIKYIRKLRGLTQKELGCRLGFCESNADIRIAQYEGGKRKPKETVVLELAKVLGVKPEAIKAPAVSSANDVVRFLFALEDEFGLCVSRNEDELSFSLKNGEDCCCRDALLGFLEEWAEKGEALKSGALSQEEYDNWRFNY